MTIYELECCVYDTEENICKTFHIPEVFYYEKSGYVYILNFQLDCSLPTQTRCHLFVCLFVCPQHNSKTNNLKSVQTWYKE